MHISRKANAHACVLAHTHTHTPGPGCIMMCSSSLRPPSSPSSPWKLVFLTNHSSCPLLSLSLRPHPHSPQETEISTRRRECEALEAEVKKKNQTCQTLVSAPKIRPRPLSERTEVGIDLYPRASPAIITSHECPQRK